jgi:hypothetical protein
MLLPAMFTAQQNAYVTTISNYENLCDANKYYQTAAGWQHVAHGRSAPLVSSWGLQVAHSRSPTCWVKVSAAAFADASVQLKNSQKRNLQSNLCQHSNSFTWKICRQILASTYLFFDRAILVFVAVREVSAPAIKHYTPGTEVSKST